MPKKTSANVSAKKAKATSTALIGYSMSGHDNDSNMLGEETRKAANREERRFFDWRFVKDGGQHPATCPKCGSKTDPDYIDPHFRLAKKRLDIGSTYDGYTIVSERFRNFCLDRAIAGIEFVPLPSQPKHFRLVVRNVIAVDREKSKGIRFLYFCDRCGRHAGVFGPDGVRFVGIDAPLRGMHRSDLEFAQAHEQHPLLLVDAEIAGAMKAERFRGLSLVELEMD